MPSDTTDYYDIPVYDIKVHVTPPLKYSVYESVKSLNFCLQSSDGFHLTQNAGCHILVDFC